MITVFWAYVYFIVDSRVEAMGRYELQPRKESKLPKKAKSKSPCCPPGTLGDPKHECCLPPLPEKEEPENKLLRNFKRRAKLPMVWYHLSIMVLTWVIFVFNVAGTREASLWTCIILLDYMRLPGGQAILAAVKKAGGGLMNSAIAALCVISAFAGASYVLFHEQIGEHNTCNTSYQCVMMGFNGGLHGDLGEMHGDDFGNVRSTRCPPVLTELLM